jgi:hypothetical protein
MVFHGCTTIIEAMDGGAFGSPVAATNVANSAIVSVGERIIRGSRIILFQDPTESTHRSTEVREIGTVELLGSGGNVVGTGVIDGNIKYSMDLNVVKLCPSEVAVWVVEISDGSVWIGEIVGERLGQCIGLVIRWKRALLQIVEGRRVQKKKVVWYWPSMRIGVQMGSGCSRTRYANYMEASWEPSLERHSWVVKEATIFSGEDVPARTRAG